MQDTKQLFCTHARSMLFSNETVDAFLNNATQQEFECVNNLLSCELEVRKRNKKERLFKRAHFPQVKSFGDYDFSQITFPENYSEQNLKSLEFIDAAQDFVFYGQTGRGKTHLAIAIGTACIAKGYSARFYTTAGLTLILDKAKREHSLENTLKTIMKNDLIILDEFGYVPLDVDSSRLLFQVVSQCYERRSMIITTNIEFSKWGSVLGDDKLASAMIDRIVHHGRLLEFTGPSHRMDASLMLGKA